MKASADSKQHLSIIQLLVCVCVVLPFATFKCINTTFTFDIKTILILIMLGVIHTGFAYILYFKCVKELKVQTVSILGYLEPIVGIIGTVLIIGGSVISEIVK